MLLNEQMIEKLSSIKATFKKFEQKLEDPELMNNMNKYQEVVKQRAELLTVVENFSAYQELAEEILNTEELLSVDRNIDTTDTAEMAEMAKAEIESLNAKMENLGEVILSSLLPKDPLDEKNILLEIRAGAGGDEAALFAADLFRMYIKYAERRNWKTEVISSHLTGIGGFKEVILSIAGKDCYSFLKFESGVHRVQRVPSTEASGRVHTSTVTVAVLPEAEEVDIQIAQKDIRIDTFCSSGPGGQSVNTTYSAVRITHVPTGTVVSCQDEKSQIKNKAKAMRVLSSRVMKLERDKLDAERTEQRRSQVGSGDRSEKIKTYNFAQNRVTDHRQGMTVYNLEFYLEGDIEEMLTSMMTYNTSQELQNMLAS